MQHVFTHHLTTKVVSLFRTKEFAMHNDDNARVAVEAQIFIGLVEDSILESEISECVSPFVAKLTETFTDAQLSTDVPHDEEEINSFDILDELVHQLPEVFSPEALQKYIDFKEMIRTMAQDEFNRAIEQVERESRENG
jgi:hypothetical protein